MSQATPTPASQPVEDDRAAAEAARTIPDLLARNVREIPNKVAYRQFDEKSQNWVSVTWKEFDESVLAWQKALSATGLVRGDHAAILLPNSINAAVCDMAVLCRGMVPVPLHAVDTPSSSAFILNDAESKILFVPRALRWNAMLATGASFLTLKKVVVVGNDAEEADPASPVPVQNLSDWLKEGNDQEISAPAISQNDLCAIVYTSGTTGKPKGVMLTHGNVISDIRGFEKSVLCNRNDTFLSFLPFSHTFERTVTYYFAMHLGAEVGFARSVAKLAEDLQIVRPTIFVSVPRVFEQFNLKIKAAVKAKGKLAVALADMAEMIGWRRFAKRNDLPVASDPFAGLDNFLWPFLEKRFAEPVKKVFGGRLRIAIAGGASLNPSISHFLCAMGIDLRQGYGLTETAPVLAVNKCGSNHPETVGDPLWNIEARVGENDELQVRGPVVMQGYWKRPEETKAAFTEDGWLRTGDQADLSDGGRVRIKGRLKEIIVTSTGEKVPPTDLELAIQTDHLFEQVMAVGEGRPFVTALAVVNPKEWEKLAKEFGADPTDEAALLRRDIRMAALKRLKRAATGFPQYGVPRNICLLREPWTVDNGLLTVTMKLRRNIIRDRFKAEIEELYKVPQANI